MGIDRNDQNILDFPDAAMRFGRGSREHALDGGDITEKGFAKQLSELLK